MQINPELIQRFFENKCDHEERAAVLQYLQNHPDAMEKFFPWKDWEMINDTLMPAAVSDEMLQHLTKELFPGNKAGRLSWLRNTGRVAAAAAILLLISTATWLYILKSSKDHIQAAAVDQPALRMDTLWIKKENHTEKTMAVLLPDGSKVRLQQNSSLKYQLAYGATKRDVYLEGQAFFQVAKQKEKPFTVLTRSLNTTALGTSFTVKVTGMDASVKLHTGKVVVKPAKELPGFTKEIYLSPGEKISYNYAQAMVTIARHTDKRIDRSPATAKEEKEMEFNNEPLNTVMATLSTRFHQTIHFNPDDITGMNFTGTIARADSLSVILRLIANMNNLVVEENGNSYTILRSRP